MRNEHIKECLEYIENQLRDLQFIKKSLKDTLENNNNNQNVWDTNTGGVINESYHLSIDVEDRQIDITSCFVDEDK